VDFLAMLDYRKDASGVPGESTPGGSHATLQFDLCRLPLRVRKAQELQSNE
jgi:hypothetical protein